MTDTGSTLLRAVRPVDLCADPRTVPAPVDVRLAGGRITELGPDLPTAGSDVLDGGGGWLLPGLWDHHVHADQWGTASQRLDTAGTTSPDEVCARVARHLAGRPAEDAGDALQGYGHRTAAWSRQPTVAELDAVSGDVPVVLISGDAHHGWLNSAALRHLGLPPRTGVIAEEEWFPLFLRLPELPGAAGLSRAGLSTALHDAVRRGVVGMVDMEFTDGFRHWPARVAAGLDLIKVRAACYPPVLAEVLLAGLRTGQPLEPSGLIEMGPLKIISDGSLSTRTAWCCEPYADAAVLPDPYGRANLPAEELYDLLARATAGGLEVAVHAIGDAAIHRALDAFAATGARGAIEHAQLIKVSDVSRLTELGVRASVQPAHLLDDRDVSGQCWPGREDRCFAFASMLRAGVDVRFGSDAPVSPLDPWLAVSAAVHRSGDDRDPWVPAQALSPTDALRCSTDGVDAPVVGGPADLVLLPYDPRTTVGSTAETAARLRDTRVLATIVAGRVVHQA
ncbi:amidohydrolase [Propionibacteriaceae bacterium Y2011]